jgi:hypothetical protein
MPPPHDCLAADHGTNLRAFPLSIAGVTMMDISRKLIRGVHRAVVFGKVMTGKAFKNFTCIRGTR